MRKMRIAFSTLLMLLADWPLRMSGDHCLRVAITFGACNGLNFTKFDQLLSTAVRRSTFLKVIVAHKSLFLEGRGNQTHWLVMKMFTTPSNNL